MQETLGSGWHASAFGCGAICVGMALVLGISLGTMVSRLQQRRQQLLSLVGVVLMALGTLFFVCALA